MSMPSTHMIMRRTVGSHSTSAKGSGKISRSTVRRIYGFARRHRAKLTGFIAVSVLVSVIGVITPILAGDVVNAITGGGPVSGNGSGGPASGNGSGGPASGNGSGGPADGGHGPGAQGRGGVQDVQGAAGSPGSAGAAQGAQGPTGSRGRTASHGSSAHEDRGGQDSDQPPAGPAAHPRDGLIIANAWTSQQREKVPSTALSQWVYDRHCSLREAGRLATPLTVRLHGSRVANLFHIVCFTSL